LALLTALCTAELLQSDALTVAAFALAHAKQSNTPGTTNLIINIAPDAGSVAIRVTPRVDLFSGWSGTHAGRAWTEFKPSQ
jgi:hypothetical protein